MMRKILKNGIKKNRVLKRITAVLVICSMILPILPSLPAGLFAVEAKADDVGTKVQKTYVLEVSTGLSAGAHVEYFCVHVTDQNGNKREGYVLPHDRISGYVFDQYSRVSSCDGLSTSANENISNVQDAIRTISMTDYRDNLSGGLSANHVDTYLFTIPYNVESVDDISFFISPKGNTDTKSAWTCTGMQLYSVSTLYGRDMAGYYSSETYWDFDGKLIAETTFQNGKGYEFQLNDSNGHQFYLNRDGSVKYGLKTGLNTAFNSRQTNKELMFRMDLADVSGGGVEALATQMLYGIYDNLPYIFYKEGVRYEDQLGYTINPQGVKESGDFKRYANIQDQTMVEAMALDIFYKDIYDHERSVTVPLISCFLGWLREYDRNLLNVPNSGIAQQGDTLVFKGVLPEFKEITKFALTVGGEIEKTCRINDRNPKYMGVDEVLADKRREALKDETVSVTAISVYDASDENKVQAQAVMNDSVITCQVNGTPIYAFTAAKVEGVKVWSNSTSTFNGKTVAEGSDIGMQVLPSFSDDVYVIDMVTDNVKDSDTKEKLFVKLTYRDRSNKERTTEIYNINEQVSGFFGYWPQMDFSAGGNSLPYANGTQRGGHLQFMVKIPNVVEFTGATIGIGSGSIENAASSKNEEGKKTDTEETDTEEKESENEEPVPAKEYDDWQMSFFNIYSGAGIRHRKIELLTSEDKLLMDIGGHFTQQIITRSLDKNDRILSYNQKTLLNTDQNAISIQFEMGGNGSSEDDTDEDLDWERMKEKMSYNETKLDHGFTKTRKTYDVKVTVADNFAANVAAEYGDSGSVNQFYFQLIFENGKSGYVLANQQLTADGFRAGKTENFRIYTNRDYGSLVAVRVIPDDTIDEEDVYDKLNIDKIEVVEGSTDAICRTWLFNDVGWVNVNYMDSGAKTTEKGQTLRYESEMASNYLTDGEDYAVNLMVAVSTGMFTNGSQFNGSLTCDITYLDVDENEVSTGPIDVSMKIAEYMLNKNMTAIETYQNHKRIQPSYMLTENHTSRFYVPLEDAKNVKSITFTVFGESSFTWPINEVDLYQIVKTGTLYRNSANEYQRSDKIEFLARTTDTPYSITVLAGGTQSGTLTFTENSITLDKENREISIKRESDPGTDTMNVLYYPAEGQNAAAISRVSTEVNYHKWSQDTYETMKLSEPLQDPAGDNFAFLSDVDIAGLTNVESISMEASEPVYLDHVIVQHVRNGVVVQNYYFDCDAATDISLQGLILPSEAKKRQKQVLTFRVDGDCERKILEAEEKDLAVSFMYISDFSINGQSYVSPYVYLTDCEYTDIEGGHLYTVTFDEEGVHEVIGGKFVMTDGSSITIDGAVLTCYDETVSGENSYLTFRDEYYFGNPIGVSRSTKAVACTEDPLTLLSIDLSAGTEEADYYEIDNIAMDIAYVDNANRDQIMHLDDMSQYISKGSLEKGGDMTVSVFIPNMKKFSYAYLLPENRDEETVAQWNLKLATVSKTFEGETTELVTSEINKPVIEGKGVYINCSKLSMVVLADVIPVNPQAETVETQIDMSNEDQEIINISTAEKLEMQVKITSGIPTLGFDTAVFMQKNGVYTELTPAEDYVLKLTDDTVLFNPEPSVAAASYKVVFTSREDDSQTVSVYVDMAAEKDMSLYMCSLDLSEDTEALKLKSDDQDIYIAFTYLAKADSPETDIRMTPYYRLSSLYGGIEAGKYYVLPKYISAGEVFKEAVIRTYVPEDSEEENEGIINLAISKLRIYLEKEHYGQAIQDTLVAEAGRENRVPMAKEQPTLNDTTAISAAKYVQSGLIAQFDGIENAAYGKRDDYALTWKDLVGTADATLTNTGDADWSEKALSLQNGLFAQFYATLPESYTIEVVCNTPYQMQKNAGAVLFGYADYSNVLNYSADSLVFSNGTATQPVLNGYDGSSVVLINERGANGLTAKLGYAGDLSYSTTATAAGTSGSQIMVIGGADEKKENFLCGEVYAIRIYNRVLTDQELLTNYVYDQLRFFNRTVEDLNKNQQLPGKWEATVDSDNNVTLSERVEPLRASARMYSTNGLVAMFDGLENVDYDTQSTTAMSWKNLVGNNFAEIMNCESAVWDRGLVMDGSLYAMFDGTLPENYTVEIVADISAEKADSGNSGAILATEDYNFGIFTQAGAAALKQRGDDRYVSLEGYTGSSVVAAVNGSKAEISLAGSLDAVSAAVLNNGAVNGRFVIGGKDEKHAVRGTIHAIRIYDHVLSDEELLTNYIYDRIRFYGASGESVVLPQNWSVVLGKDGRYYAKEAPLASDISASLYVQSGLIANFDGIENAGSGKHTDKLNEWTDLTGSYTAVFNNAYDGCWTDRSLNIQKGLYAAFDAAIPADATIEIVADAPYTTSSKAQQTLFMSKDGNVAIYRDGAGLKLKVGDDGSKARPEIANYNGSSVVAMFGGGSGARLGYEGSLDFSTAAFGAGKAQSNTWCIGGANDTDILLGKIYAVRIYDSALSSQQMLTNYVLDQMRFFGKSIDEIVIPAGFTASLNADGSVNIRESGKAVDAGYYVTDGLITRFDAIENSGIGRHDAMAKTWKNLTGNNSATLVNAYTGCFGENSLDYKNGLYARFGLNLPAVYTIEVVCDAPITDSSARYQTVLSDSEGTTKISRSGTSLVWKQHDSTNGPKIGSYDGSSVVVQADGSKAAFGYAGSIMPAMKTCDAGGSLNSNFVIGGTNATHQLTGKVYAVRIYNRILSEQELLTNYVNDRIRFFGEKASSVVLPEGYAVSTDADGHVIVE